MPKTLRQGQADGGMDVGGSCSGLPAHVCIAHCPPQIGLDCQTDCRCCIHMPFAAMHTPAQLFTQLQRPQRVHASH